MRGIHIFIILVLVALYVFIGFGISSLYFFFAGWDYNHVINCTIFAPTVVSVLWLLWIMPHIPCINGQKPGYPLFWFVLGYFMLPILINGVSLAFYFTDYHSLSNLFYEYRFWGVKCAIILTIIGIFVWIWIEAIIYKLSQIFTRPVRGEA